MKQYQENIKECQKNGEIWTNTSQWTKSAFPEKYNSRKY